MFSGELVDTRTPKQKRRDQAREAPRQDEMFSQRELAQFGVQANPKMPLSPKTRLELAMEDRRTEEEIAANRQREAERRTYPLPGVEQAPAHTETAPQPEPSPVYRQYREVKQEFPNAILFMELGDFYEAFDEDAEIAARELDIVLVSRAIGRDRRVAMAGVPRHSAEHYVSRLVEKGYYVALCEQVGEEPVDGVMPRKVTRVAGPLVSPDSSGIVYR